MKPVRTVAALTVLVLAIAVLWSSGVFGSGSSEPTPLLTQTFAETTPSPDVTAEGGEAPAWLSLPEQEIDGVRFRHYATVSRTDGSYRQMFINEGALLAWAAGESLPEGAFFVMETYYSPGVESTNFTKGMTGDGFRYGSFSPNRPTFETRANLSCTACHSVAADGDGTFTLPMLERAIEDGQVMTTTCGQAGRIPCESAVYSELLAVLEAQP